LWENSGAIDRGESLFGPRRTPDLWIRGTKENRRAVHDSGTREIIVEFISAYFSWLDHGLDFFIVFHAL
jgi:hypothetical protein